MLKHKEIKAHKENDGKAKRHNLLSIKDYLDLKYEFRRNDLTLEIEYRLVDNDQFVLMDESHVNSIWIDLQVDGYQCSDKTLLRILNSRLTEAYNPVKDYFDNLRPHDGQDHIADLAKTVKISEVKVGEISLSDLWRPYLEKWLVATVATALGKGINHLCLILVGGQGTGKTSWLNNLCPKTMSEFLICSHINPSLTDQNTANFLAEKWFVNIDDQLETIFGKDFNSMKAIITAPFVTNRKTWHRFTKKRQRICSFMGSVNNMKFLTDTENRRYLVFKAENINFNHNVDIEKVWAQALFLLENNFPFWFKQEEMKQLNKFNEIFRQVPVEEEWLMMFYKPCKPDEINANFLMPSQILAKLNAHSGMKLSIRKLSSAMDKLGFGEPISKRINGDPRKVYPVIERMDYDENNHQIEF